MSLLTKAFTLSGIARSPWILGGLVAVLVAFGGASFTFGFRSASNSCQADKERSQRQAATEAAKANNNIADIRVDAERDRADVREEFDDVLETFENLESLQSDLVANGCELDPDRLRELNRAILRAGGAD